MVRCLFPTPPGALLTLLAAIAAAQISGCTSQGGAPQGKPTVVSGLPNPGAVPPSGEVAPPPAAQPGQQVQSPEQVTTEGRAKVALVVPLTGVNKPVGQAMLDAGNLALFDVSSDLALLPRDAGSSPEGARAAAEKAVSDGAGLVLGPVFATSVPPVRDATEGAQINVVAYSTDASVAGGNVFVMGFLPAQQVDRVVGYAKSRGLAKLAALVPDNAYGTAVAAEIGRIREKLGLQPPRILKLGKDVKAQLDALAQDNPDMLMIALGGDQLRSLAPQIAEFKAAHPVQLLGTGLWDDKDLAQVAVLAGGWYAAPLPSGFANFEAKFEQTYNYKPPRIASLAYDSVALAAAIAKGAPGNTNPFGRDVLTQPNGFLGIDGTFRFLDSGLSERNLAVLAIDPAGPQVLDPPPPSFTPLGG